MKGKQNGNRGENGERKTMKEVRGLYIAIKERNK